MNTFHMKYFVDAAQTGSLQKSAALNHVTHSAISLAIRTLEKEIGAELLVHEKRKFALTPEGEVVRGKFEQWLREMEELKSTVTAVSDVPTGTLRIIAAQSLMTTSINDALVEFRKHYPKVKVSLSAGTAAAVHSALLANEADIGILVDHHRLNDCESKSISRGKFLLVKKPSAKTRLEDGVIVTSTNKVEVQHLAQGLRKSSKQKRNLIIEMEIMSWTLIKSLVLKTHAIGYVPDYMVKDELQAGKLTTVAQPVAAFDYEILAAWPKSRPLHRNAKLFLEALR
jgi:DNA-binding transcriptional LysR family regulator